MLRDTKSRAVPSVEEDDAWARDNYFTYRPLSNLPTPPPSSRDSSAAQSPKTTLEDGEELQAKFRGSFPYALDVKTQSGFPSTNHGNIGPAIHLVNLIPSSASLAIASVHLVQAMLSTANLPIETVALAVCILDSLDAKFARTWRISCPLRPSPSNNSTSSSASSSSKRHTMPPGLLSCQWNLQQQQQQLHIDAVNPELIVLTALVIAAKFTEDFQESAQHYCQVWGRGMWSNEQLNATERCIMEKLGYRIMPLCDDACLTDAMVDMQLAGRQQDWHLDVRQPTPPESLGVTPIGVEDMDENSFFVPSHSRSKTMAAVSGLGVLSSPLDGSVGSAASFSTTPSPL